MSVLNINTYLLFYMFISFVNHLDGYKIMAVFPSPSKSHSILGNELLKGLAQHGHEVTMLSPYALRNPPKNYTHIAIDKTELYRIYEENVIKPTTIDVAVLKVYRALGKLSSAFFKDNKVRNFLKSRQKFDAIIYYQFNFDSTLGLSYVFNASTILFSVSGVNQFSTHLFNTDMPCAYVPSMYSRYGIKMNFWERFKNCWIELCGKLYLWYVLEPLQQRLLTDNIPNAPSLKELRNNVDLMLVNSHPAVDFLRPTFQNMINIGGYYYHIHEDLPDYIQLYLDNSKEVIYFSFGSNLNSLNIEKHLIDGILKFFRQTQYNILWKFDVHLPETPANVKIVSWVPQRAVLDHPNVKLLITHGGKGSINEAIYYGMPVVGIPFFFDQYTNVEFCVQAEIGVRIDRENISHLEEAVTEVMNNTKYRRNMHRRSQMFRHQVVDPMKKAVYWIEYAIKNKGSKILKVPTLELSWYQIYLVDVVIVAVLIVLLIVVSLYFLVCKLVSVLSIRQLKKHKNL